MKLNQKETEVLEEFKRRVREQFPKELVNMLWFLGQKPEEMLLRNQILT